MQEIVITDSRVELKEVSVVKTVSLESYKKSLSESLGFQTPMLPLGSIFYACRGEMQLVVVEKPPEMNKVKYRDEVVQEFEVGFPYTYYFVSFRRYSLAELRVFCQNKPIRLLSDELCYLPVPNISEDGQVCLGDYRFSVSGDLARKVVDVLRFWEVSEFNNDITSVYAEYMPQEIRDLTSDGSYFEGWQKIPLDEVCGFKWQFHAKFEDIVAGILERR